MPCSKNKRRKAKEKKDLKFKNIRREDNGLVFDVTTTDAEVMYLVNHAVSNLLMEGIISLNENGDAEQEVTLREVTH